MIMLSLKASGVVVKNELVHHERYETRAQDKASIIKYIEIFDNRQRRHSSFGKLSPVKFTKQAKF